MFDQATLDKVLNNMALEALDDIDKIILNHDIDEDIQCAQIKLILDKCKIINLNDTNLKRVLPLHHACSQNKIKIVSLLLENGANINIPCIDKIIWTANDLDKSVYFPRTPLQFAIRASRIIHQGNPLIEMLLEKGAAVNHYLDFSTDHQQIESVLADAIEFRPGIIPQLIAKGALVDGIDAIYNRDLQESLLSKLFNSQYAKIWLEEAQLIDLMKSVITAGININYTDAAGQSPFWHAISNRYFEAAKILLLEYKADIQAEEIEAIVESANEEDKTKFEVIIALIKIYQNNKILDSIDAVMLNADIDEIAQCAEIAKILELNPQLNLNDPQRKPQLPLHRACAAGKLKIAELLIAKKADVNIENPDYNPTNANSPRFDILTPLQFAIWGSRKSKDTALIQMLIEKGANVNYQKIYPNHTAFVLVDAILWRPDILPLLIKFGADVTAPEKATPKISLLLELFQKLDRQSAQEAEQEVEKEDVIVKYMEHLIKAGANVNFYAFYAEESQGHKYKYDCPLLYAVADRYHEIAMLLLKNNANINLDNKNTILHEAVRIGNLEIIKVLLEKGADPKQSLHWLVQESYLLTFNLRDVVTLLIRYGADVDVLHAFTPEVYANNEINAVVKVKDTPSDENPLPCNEIGLLQNDENLHAFWVRDGQLRIITPPKTEAVEEILELLNKTVSDKALKKQHRIELLQKIKLTFGWKNSCDELALILLEHGAKIDAKNTLGQTVLENPNISVKIKEICKNFEIPTLVRLCEVNLIHFWRDNREKNPERITAARNKLPVDHKHVLPEPPVSAKNISNN